MSEISVDGTTMTVRPIAACDIARLERVFTRLSRESIRFRFFTPIRRLPRPALMRLALVDRTCRDALVVLVDDEIIAVARYDAIDASEAEVAVTVVDEWQHRGIGIALVRELARLADERGFLSFVANILPDNRAALGLVHEVADEAAVRFEDGRYVARFQLRDVHVAA